MKRRTLIAALGALVACFFAAAHRAAPTSSPLDSAGHAALHIATHWDRRLGTADGPIPKDRKAFVQRGDAVAFCGGDRFCSVETAVAIAPHAFSSATTLPALPLFLVVPGRDGFRVRLSGKEAWITPGELLAMQAYDRGRTPFSALGPGAEAGIDEALVLARAASALGESAGAIRDDATVERVRFETPPHPRFPATGGFADLLAAFSRKPSKREAPRPQEAMVRDAIARAAGYLERHLRIEGRFDYLVQGTTALPKPGYLWARHAGTVFFLAQAAGVTKNIGTSFAAQNALRGMKVLAVRDCGGTKCIAEDENVVGIGATALAVIALAEFEIRKLPGADPEFRKELVKFLLAQRLPDGTVAHQYDRDARAVIPSKLPYYDGEVALALARSFTLDGDPALRDAARTLLENTVKDTPKGYAGLLYPGEEHWTCQALDALWDASPSEAAFARCVSWHRGQGAQQFVKGDSVFVEPEGGFGPTSIALPRVTPAASRSEAAGATLAVALRRGAGAETRDFLRDQLDAAVLFLLREQLPGRHSPYLADPDAVDGGFPASPVDLRIQIDYVQHAGSCLVRWLELPH